MKILLTGPTGQIGSALAITLSRIGEVVAAGRDRMDLARPDSIRNFVRAIRPSIIINAAAYTAVDRAESEEALAMNINANAPSVLAAEALNSQALLIHFSTDYVFDGEKSSPYVETDPTNPLNAYGRTKLKGEEAVQASGCRFFIFRTCWVYALAGNNFLLTMLRLAREGKPLRVVDDQYGTPTSNLMIAGAVAEVLRRATLDSSLGGIFHMSARGETTWHDFADAIFRERGVKPHLTPVQSSQYVTAARRPRYSVLDNSKLEHHVGVRLPSWDAGLRQVLALLP